MRQATYLEWWYLQTRGSAGAKTKRQNHFEIEKELNEKNNFSPLESMNSEKCVKKQFGDIVNWALNIEHFQVKPGVSKGPNNKTGLLSQTGFL